MTSNKLWQLLPAEQEVIANVSKLCQIHKKATEEEMSRQNCNVKDLNSTRCFSAERHVRRVCADRSRSSEPQHVVFPTLPESEPERTGLRCHNTRLNIKKHKAAIYTDLSPPHSEEPIWISSVYVSPHQRRDEHNYAVMCAFNIFPLGLTLINAISSTHFKSCC